jgi:hypothetical protein
MSKRKPIRKLYTSEIIKRLNALEKRWPDSLSLFAESGSLLLINQNTKEVLEGFSIDCDGGNAGTYFFGGKEYLALD